MSADSEGSFGLLDQVDLDFFFLILVVRVIFADTFVHGIVLGIIVVLLERIFHHLGRPQLLQLVVGGKIVLNYLIHFRSH